MPVQDNGQTCRVVIAGRHDLLVHPFLSFEIKHDGGSSGYCACTTRLRLTLADPALADETALRALGARGVIRPGGDALQVVLGPIADAVAGEMRDVLRAPPLLGSELEQALGGPANIRETGTVAGRLRVVLHRPNAIDEDRIDRAAPHGWARVGGSVLHILR